MQAKAWQYGWKTNSSKGARTLEFVCDVESFDHFEGSRHHTLHPDCARVRLSWIAMHVNETQLPCKTSGD